MASLSYAWFLLCLQFRRWYVIGSRGVTRTLTDCSNP